MNYNSVHQFNQAKNIYDNTRYINTRNKRRMLIIDLDDSDNTHLGGGTEFNIKLYEPFKIDKKSEIYLDNFTTFNSNLAFDYKNIAFLLKIKEFNMNIGVASNTNNSNIYNSIVIPNDNTSVLNYHTAVSHKSKKFNYVCDINPTTITNITGSITNLEGEPIFHNSSSANPTQFTYVLRGIDNPWNIIAGQGHPIERDEVINSITAGGAVQFNLGDNVRCISHTDLNGSEITFTSTLNLANLNVFRNSLIQINMARGLQFQVGAAAPANSPVVLQKQNGRFIAEFLIISQE